jgi:Putative metallopeptidase
MRRSVTGALVARLCSSTMEWSERFALVPRCRLGEAMVPLLRTIGPRNKTCLRRHVPFVSISTLVFGVSQLVAQPRPYEPSNFEERMQSAASALESSVQLRDRSPQYRQNLAEFVSGNLLFVLCHEIAHVAMTQMRLPVLGKAEDAADSFATLRMIKVGSAFSRTVLLDASTGWFLSARRDEEIGEKLVYYDEHGLDRQRAYQIVCLMVGSDKEQFKSLAEETGLPPGRQNSCVDDYASASYSWDLVLGPHLRSADQPKTTIDVAYGPAESELGGAAQAARSIRLLETVAENVAEVFVWPTPFTIAMQSCGFPNAYWAVSEHKLIVCYELAIEFAELYRNYGPTPTEGEGRLFVPQPQVSTRVSPADPR